MSENALHTHPRQNKGPALPKALEQDQFGNLLITYDQEVDVGSTPNLTKTFGILFEEVHNEKNARRSRHTQVTIDTDDLFSAQVKDRFKFQTLGGGFGTETTSVETAVDGLSAPTANSLLLTGSSVEHYGRAHAVRKDEVVDAWNSFVRKEILHHPDAGGNKMVETAQVLDDGTAVPDTSLTLNAWNEYVDSEKVLQVVQTAPDGFGTISVETDLDPDALGGTSFTDTTIVDLPYVMPAADYLTIDQSLTELGNGRGRYVKKYVTSWPTFIDQEEESETGMEVLVTRTIEDKATWASHNKGQSYEVHNFKNIDPYKGLHVLREIDNDIINQTWTEFHMVTMYVPSVLDPDNPFSLVSYDGSTSLVSNKSADISYRGPGKFVITYHTTPQTPDATFHFFPIDINISSPEIRVFERDVLCDEATIEYYPWGVQSFVAVPTLPKISVTYSASNPTATEYLDTIVGTEQLIADTSVRWKFNLYKRVKVYMGMPDLDLTHSGAIYY